MSYANSHAVETSLNGTETISFPWPVREIQITNDSAVNDLKYKFKSAETFSTLKPGESRRLPLVRIHNLFLSTSASVAYRIWGIG